MGFVHPLTQSSGSGKKVFLSDMPSPQDVMGQYIPLKIKTILSLDAQAAKPVQMEAKKHGIIQYIMPIDPISPTPSARVVYKWIKDNKDKDIYPLLIHCRAGKDRTGFAAASWLIHNLGYNPKQAIDLMNRSYQYGTGGISTTAKSELDSVLYGSAVPSGKTNTNPNQPDISQANDIDVVGESQKQNGAMPGSSTLSSWAPYSDIHESYPTIDRTARLRFLRRFLKLAVPQVSDDELEIIFDSTNDDEKPISMEGSEELPKRKTTNIPKSLNIGNIGQRNNYQAIPDTFLNAPSGSPGAPNGGAPMEPGGLVQL